MPDKECTDNHTCVGANRRVSIAISKKESFRQILATPTLVGLFLVVFQGCSKEKDAVHAVDHIILAIHNLDSGINQIRSLTGIEPIYGGEHPDSYTHNALFSVGTDTYVEILAPRNDLDSVPDYFKQFDKLTPIGWAISSTNIESTKRTLENERFKMGEIIPGSRVAANGKKLEWKTCVLLDSDDESAPFFINWDFNTTHPSQNSPPGCTLKRIRIGTKSQAGLGRLPGSLGLSDSRLAIDESGSGGLELVLQTPRGEVIFSNNKWNTSCPATEIKYAQHFSISQHEYYKVVKTHATIMRSIDLYDLFSAWYRKSEENIKRRQLPDFQGVTIQLRQLRCYYLSHYEK